LFIGVLSQEFKKVVFIIAHLSFIMLDVQWYDIIVLNVHTPSKDKDDDIKNSFYEEMQQLFDQFPDEKFC
jgi:hypothetical protein